MVRRAEKTQELRLGADYEAQHVEAGDAEEAVTLADEFVAAIEALYARLITTPSSRRPPRDWRR
jgi:hypothetical protein